jgi:hypothetical protein
VINYKNTLAEIFADIATIVIGVVIGTTLLLVCSLF